VEAHPEARVGGFVRLSVRDTGTGIAPEHLSGIFEPFFTTKEVGKGTGLGLATVYGIVKQHQGWIEVSSQPGAGTVFKIYFPSIQPPADGTSLPGPKSTSRGGTESILLVEDDPGVRSLTKRTLEKSGYQVFEAATGGEALRVLENCPADINLLLADVVLPGGVSGCDLVDQFLGRMPSLKVILISGYGPDAIGSGASPPDRQNCSFLQKPFPPQVLIDAVRDCLDG
jgi:two-component system, cell cycle sensor histidine kinase and response regulator CckA